jgi:hypothetical protein
MLNEDGKLVRHWGGSSVPDVTKLETQLWSYYLAGAYIDLGCVDGVSLLDFNSFPMRIKETPETPYEAVLEVNHLDSIYKKSKGCISLSGWSCESLPYLVAFDNFGCGRLRNVADTSSIFVWGWDEVSWFALQDEGYRNQWLRYAHRWIRETDPNGHLQMPVSRVITCPNASFDSYRANTKSPNCPINHEGHRQRVVTVNASNGPRQIRCAQCVLCG